jgi:Protein of unknown function (DUF551)
VEWIKYEDQKPTFDGYRYIIVHLKTADRCCDTLTAERHVHSKDENFCEQDRYVADQSEYNENVLISACINHSQTCGTHSLKYDEIDYWMPLPQPPKI